MYRVEFIPKERRQTYYFLKEAKKSMPILINTGVDMSKIEEYRTSHTTKFSYIAFIIFVISRVLINYKQANSIIRDSFFRHKIAFFSGSSAKFTLDKTINNSRAVVSAVIQNSHTFSLDQIQEYIDYYKDTEFDDIPEFSALRKLQKLPIFWGRLLYNLVTKNFYKKHALQGTFTVTSVGNQPVQTFIPMGTTALTFGVGQITDQVIVVNKEMHIKPILCLNMVFDHRVLDGAIASEILSEIKMKLENFDYKERNNV